MGRGREGLGCVLREIPGLCLRNHTVKYCGGGGLKSRCLAIRCHQRKEKPNGIFLMCVEASGSHTGHLSALCSALSSLANTVTLVCSVGRHCTTPLGLTI